MFTYYLTRLLTLCSFTVCLLLLGGCSLKVDVDLKPPYHFQVIQDGTPTPEASVTPDPAPVVVTTTTTITVYTPITSLHVVNVHSLNAVSITEALGQSYQVDSQKVISITNLNAWLAGFPPSDLQRLRPLLALAHELTATVPITILLQGQLHPLILFMTGASGSDIECVESQKWEWQEMKLGGVSHAGDPVASDYKLLVAAAPVGKRCLLPGQISLQTLDRFTTNRNLWIDFLVLQHSQTQQTTLYRLLKLESVDGAGGGEEAISDFCSQWECEKNWLGEWFCYIVGC